MFLWRDKKIHDFHNFSNSGLKFYMRISECKCSRIMMKKKSIFWPIFGHEAVLNIIAQASGLTKLIFMRWKTRNSMSSPIPEHENSRFWLFRDKFVIVEAVSNIILRATAFTRVFSTQKFKKSKSNLLPQNRVFFNHPNEHTFLGSYLQIQLHVTHYIL